MNILPGTRSPQYALGLARIGLAAPGLARVHGVAGRGAARGGDGAPHPPLRIGPAHGMLDAKPGATL